MRRDRHARGVLAKPSAAMVPKPEGRDGGPPEAGLATVAVGDLATTRVVVRCARDKCAGGAQAHATGRWSAVGAGAGAEPNWDSSTMVNDEIATGQRRSRYPSQ